MPHTILKKSLIEEENDLALVLTSQCHNNRYQIHNRDAPKMPSIFSSREQRWGYEIGSKIIFIDGLHNDIS